MDAKTSMPNTGSLRSNKKIEVAVNRGLAACLLSGTEAGAIVMREEGVPLHVSARVLSNPGKRRASDWQQNALPLPFGRQFTDVG